MRILTETEQLARCVLDDVAVTPNGQRLIAQALLDTEDRAHRYADVLRYIADYRMTGTEQTLHIDFQGKAREVLAEGAGSC